MKPPLVSVVIPAFNAGKHLSATLDSVLTQNYPRSLMEVVLVDDGSTDDTRAVASRYLDRIVYIHQRNAGLAAARNTGMSAATGELIAWMDADDLCAVDRLRIQAAYLEHRPDVVGVGSDFSMFDDVRGVFEREGAASYYGQIGRRGLPALFPLREQFGGSEVEWFGDELIPPCTVHRGSCWRNLVFGNFLHPPTLMFRRTAREKAGWLRTDVPMAEDWEYSIRLSDLGPLAFIAAPLLLYRCHPKQMSGEHNSVPSQVSCLRVLGNVVSANTERLDANTSEVRGAFAKYHASAARGLAQQSRLRAIWHLAMAARFDLRTAHIAKNAVRILAGRQGISLVRQLRARSTKGAGAS